MPTQKDFKRLVRARMKKTGESYTAARSHLLDTPPAAKPKLRLARVAKPDYATLAGMSDAAIKAKTGCAWDKWVKSLDYHGAREWPHRKIAEFVHEKYKISGWWSQAVTVGYERICGLREIGQRRGGSYEATKSRTFGVPVTALYDAFAAPRKRSRWLAGVDFTVRKATPHKSVRMAWHDGTAVQVWLVAKGAGKSSAQVQHTKLPDRDAVARTKAFWAERLDALGALLTR